MRGSGRQLRLPQTSFVTPATIRWKLTAGLPPSRILSCGYFRITPLMQKRRSIVISNHSANNVNISKSGANNARNAFHKRDRDTTVVETTTQSASRREDVHIETFFITGVLSSALLTSPPRLPDSISYLIFPLECKTC
jgi:hypothetical protein